jgi:hypothetical protein
LQYKQLRFGLFVLQVFEKNSMKFVVFWLAACMSANVSIISWQADDENEKDGRKSENLFIFYRNLQTILLTGKPKNYRVIS